MDIKNNKNNKNKIIGTHELLSISLIKEIITNYISKNNTFKADIIENLRIFDKIDYCLQHNLIPKYSLFKFNLFLKFMNGTNNYCKKEFNDCKETTTKNKIIFIISIIYLRININSCNHCKIRRYLKLLLIFYISGKISNNNFFCILEIILISIIEELKRKSLKLYQIYDIKNEPLLFIEDIIESIINFPIIMMKYNLFIDNLITLFKELFQIAEKLNIILKESDLWLKLFEINSVKVSSELLEDDSYHNSIIKIIDFLKEIYKNNIPKNIYTELYKRSSIDSIYYINTLTMLKDLVEKEMTKQKKFVIDKGVYLLGTNFIKENLYFPSNEFSIILSFKLFKNNTESNIFKLILKEKNIFLLSIKNDCLYIEINNDFKWNTDIKINKKSFNFIIIVYSKKNKTLQLYINYEEISDKIAGEKSVYKKNVGIPKFGKFMEAIIGDKNLYGIFGDIFFINISFDINAVNQIFNSKGYYSNLIIRNNVKCDLIKNIIYSKNYEDVINNYKSLKYEYILIFNDKLFLPKESTKNNSLLEFQNTNCCIDFLNSKGIEFLTFMLHHIDSIITESKSLSIYLSKILGFLSCILEYQINIEIDYIIEFDKEILKNQLSIFFMTLFHILKSNEDNKYFRILSDDIWYCLLKIFSLDLENSTFYNQIILSILLDYDLFDQSNFITEINDILDKIKINEHNDELFYKLLLIDFIFESDSINHKNYLNLLNSVCSSQNHYFCLVLIKYIFKVESEIKKYHYLKVIYMNIKNIKNILKEDIHYLYEFIDKQFETIDHFHCKYCLYVIILCYLIKQEIIYNKDDIKKEIIEINNFSFMNNPSYLFIRTIFIENFDLKNEIKLRFIKSKNDNIYFNPDIFISLEYHPFELYQINRFLLRFKSILKYIDFLFSLEQKDNIKNIFEYFFNFIIDFSEKIRKKYTDNSYIQKDINKTINEFYSSKEFTDFFIIYLKYKQNIALEKIKTFINNNYFFYSTPFYFRLINLKFIINENGQNNSEDIKLEIIKYISVIIINSNKHEIEKKHNFNNLIIFLILIHKNFYQNELKKELSNNYLHIFINLYYFLRDKNILLSFRKISLSHLDPNEEYINKNVKNKLICEIILDIILKFFFLGNYNEQMIKSLLIKTTSVSIFYEQDETKLLSNIKDKEENLDEINDFSFCLYFLIYFFEKYSTVQEIEKQKFIENILNIIANELKNLYIQNKKLITRLKKIKIKGKIFYIYNNLLDFCNKIFKENKESDFNVIILQEQYNQIVTQLKNENEKEIKKTLNEEKNNENNNNNKSHSISGQYLENNNDNSNKSIDLNLIEWTNYIDENIIKEENIISSEKYLKNELNKIDIINLYLTLAIGDEFIKDITKILFNPKEYFIWNKFQFIFKSYIFYNKKFNKVCKAFKIHLNNINKKNEYTNEYDYKEDDNYYLNYPTKLRNYTNDEYYRPFLKPYMNFFHSNYLKITHPYIPENLLKNLEFKEEIINLIKYKRIIPKLNNEKYFCELFKNKGNIFGYIELNSNCFIFKNSPSDDLSSSDDAEKCLPYLYSIKDDKIIDKDRYVLIYYDEIKEIMKRRVCLQYIGLEIFLKNNRTYMFNFFDKKVINMFINEIKKHTQNKKKFKINSIFTNKEPENQNNEIKNSQININGNLTSNINILNQNKSEINFKLIEDPITEFNKMQLQSKNKKGNLSNFNYLLLINKYSSRTYNDYNQYLIFPLLFLDIENNVKRDLSKVVSLNRDNKDEIIARAQSNYSSFKYHFSQHYSNSGFLLTYLVRLIPFTYQHIIFQSYKFDDAARIFSSLNQIYGFLNTSGDNRELIPEFYYSLDFLINLNQIDFGIVKKNKINYHLNNVHTHCKFSFPEFIIKSRNNLEKSDLSPWIDYIFGVKQTFVSDEEPCLFNLDSYEEYNELEKIKESDKPLEQKVKEIKNKVEILKFGITPAKVFNRLHEKRNIKEEEKEHEMNISDKKEQKSINIINKFIQKKIKEKLDFYFINTKNENEIELIFKFRNKIDIFKLKFGETKYIEISQQIQEQVIFEPYNNSLCEIFPEIYCIVRHIDNTISFISKNNIISIYHFHCLVTAVENKYNKNSEDKTYKEIFLADERGFLHLIEINFDINHNQKSYEINNIKIKNSAKVHEKNINGLLYNERLNVIISWSDENDDYICINNDYNLNLINIIKLEKDLLIKEILVSKYDLIYISCYEKKTEISKIYCYSINGIRISFDESYEKIIKCFVDEKINIIFANKNGVSFYLYTFDEIYENLLCFSEDVKLMDIKVNNCQYYPQNKTYLMILSNNNAFFVENDNNLI